MDKMDPQARLEIRHVAAIVLHFRTPKHTLECLRSLWDESIGRIIVVDNSEDMGKSLALMEQGLHELRVEGLRIDLVRPRQNLGFALGVDAGLEKLGGDGLTDVLLINSDAKLQRGSLGPMIAMLPDAPIVVPRVCKLNDFAASAFFEFYQCMFGMHLHKCWLGTIRYASGCCLLIRKDYARCGLFDRDFFFYGEDVMLGFDLHRRHAAVVGCIEAVVLHEGSVSAKNGSMFYEYHMNRGHWLLACKLARNKLERAIFICMRCITLPVRATIRSARWRSFVPWRGLLVATVDVLRGSRSESFTPPPRRSV